jgi:hypothetical protein
MRTGALVLAGLIGLVSSASAREEGASAISLALADAVRSDAVGPAALTFNPAAMHQFMLYAIETGYEYSQPIDGHTFTASVVDSATNAALAMGMTYSYIYGTEQGTDVPRVGHNLRFGAASGYRNENWSVHIGAGGRYLNLTIGDAGSAEGITMDVGLLAVIQGMFRIAIVGHHLIDTGLAETPRQMAFGASFYMSSFLIGFDAVLDFESAGETTAQYKVGAEYAVADRFPIRVGFHADRLKGTKTITAGLGFISRVAGADFGFSQNLDDSSDNVFSINIRGFIP